MTPGSRPAHPPLRGPFAASGFLPDRQDAPSLARPDFRRRPVGSSGNPASAQRDGKAGPLPRFSHRVKTNFRIASGVIKASAPLVFIFCFIRIPLHAVNNRQNQPFGKTENLTGEGFSGGIRRAEERTEARTARHGSRDEDGCARDGASGRSVRPQRMTKEQRRLPDAGIVKGLARAH